MRKNKEKLKETESYSFLKILMYALGNKRSVSKKQLELTARKDAKYIVNKLVPEFRSTISKSDFEEVVRWCVDKTWEKISKDWYFSAMKEDVPATSVRKLRKPSDSNPFEQDVISSISQCGWKLHPQILVNKYRVDIGVVSKEDKTKYLCGIECDGATYHGSEEKRAKDSQRQNEIESMGLKIIRIWSTDWIERKEEVLRETLDLLDRLSDGIP